MELRPGYKRTDVGVIPEDWDVQQLAKVADVRGGIAKNSNVAVSDPVLVHYLRVANVQDGFLDLSDVSKIELSRRDLRRYSVLPGDVLMNEGGDLDKLGRGAIWKGTISPCVHQNHVFVVRCRSQLLPEYLDVWTGTRPARRFFLFAGKQTTNLASISKSSLGELPVAFPPIPEQRAIAAALSDVDALLGGLDRLIAKKRDLKQAAMQQLLTFQTRLPGFHGEWEAVEFGEVASIRNAKVVASSTPPGTQCVELDSIAGEGSGRLLAPIDATGLSSKYSFKKGDVLFGRLRAYLRKYWLATFDGVCSTEIWPLIARDNRLCGGFLHLLVQTHDFANAAGVSYGTHMPRSDWSVLKKIPIRLPPVGEQTAIAAVLSDMDAELSAFEARRDKTHALKQGMMQELLTGRTRLV